MYGLQRLCYGALRPIEIEQLYEKAWFAITETCLAMTIFREEVGAWFLVMFVALLTGKVWGWIGDGRVEVLEQQPPANPRLFHIRLTISLSMSVLYDLWLMNYTINTVIQQARPNMMVMFLFEFAVLTTSSFATAFRYCISLVETKIVKKQTQQRIEERRREVREERAEMIRRREAAVATAGEEGDAAQSDVPLPSEDDVDEMDIEVPGWETKGHWVLTLDLITGQYALRRSSYAFWLTILDFVKLGIYVTFFVILLMFYGLPIHIMRDLFLTARSFTKRLTAFMKYRRATRDMNTLYEDATVEDIQREDTCIICREEMRPWSVTNPQPPPAAQGAMPPARPAATVNERSRPKKLPCGHILHLGCLKSWLERQQMCPTCRRSVVVDPQQAQRDAANNDNPAVGAAQVPFPGQPDGAAAQPPAANRGVGRGMRMLNLGPVRIGFGQANLQDLAQGLGGPQAGQEHPAAGGPRVYGLELGFPRRLQPQPQPQAQAGANPTGSHTMQDHLQQVEQQIVAEIRSLQITQQELQLVQLLQAELARLRLMQNGQADPLTANFQMPQMPQLGPLPGRHTAQFAMPVPQMQRHGARSNTAAIPAGSADLPPGVTIPEGWSLLPLQRFDGSTVVPPAAGVPVQGPAANAGAAPTATTSHAGISPMTGTSNNTLTPTPTINPETHSQASSVDSSNTNAIHTPPSITPDQLNPPLLNTTAQAQNTTNSSNAVECLAAQQDSSVLPNWGSSQLFSASSGAVNSDSTSSSSAQPLGPGEGQVVAADGGLSSSVEPGNGEEQRRREKGKAKAATVEDTGDEAEGA